MSDPQDESKESDLDLDAETVEDLELNEDDADNVRGGPGASGYNACHAG